MTSSRRRRRRAVRRPAHPYTAGLMGSFPPLTGRAVAHDRDPGQPARPAAAAPGCRFHPRCPHARERCQRRGARASARSALPTGAPHATSRGSCRDRRRSRAAGARGALAVAYVLGRRELLGRRGRRCAQSTTSASHLAARTRHRARRRERQRQEHGRAPALPTCTRRLAARSSSTARTSPACVARRRVRAYRSQVQMIFQDPFASLNPVKRVGHHLARPLRIHRIVTQRRR